MTKRASEKSCSVDFSSSVWCEKSSVEDDSIGIKKKFIMLKDKFFFHELIFLYRWHTRRAIKDVIKFFFFLIFFSLR